MRGEEVKFSERSEKGAERKERKQTGIWFFSLLLSPAV
jgi:hypothetical protein